MARSYELIGNKEKSSKYYNEVIQMNANGHNDLNFLGLSFYKLGQVFFLFII